ncbi:hypothetical protein J4Q44_G00002670 [Coregonus suidteri]|uniref:Uncharacterized protein n=1 Tax=Coregonus suidteri TaxID=861788 RepID=A0AAN8ME96_9TELE
MGVGRGLLGSAAVAPYSHLLHSMKTSSAGSPQVRGSPSPASPEGDEPGHRRKVSFFDDVTVYVLDQSLTRQLQKRDQRSNPNANLQTHT